MTYRTCTCIHVEERDSTEQVVWRGAAIPAVLSELVLTLLQSRMNARSHAPHMIHVKLAEPALACRQAAQLGASYLTPARAFPRSYTPATIHSSVNTNIYFECTFVFNK